MKSESGQMNGCCEKWKWTHGQLEWKVTTWKIEMKIESEHMNNWNKSE